MKTTSTTKTRNRLLELLNSHGVGFARGIDQLSDPKSAEKLLMMFGDPKREDLEKTVTEVRHLRRTLHEIIAKPESSAGWRALDSISNGVHYAVSFNRATEPELEVRSGNPIVATVLKDVAAILRARDWDRFKVCADPPCGAIFFDTSRSKTQRWHSYAICGNKANVAAYRSRK